MYVCKQYNVAKPHNVFTEIHLAEKQGWCHHETSPPEFSEAQNHAVQKKAESPGKLSHVKICFGKGRKVKKKIFRTTTVKNQKSPAADHRILSICCVGCLFLLQNFHTGCTIIPRGNSIWEWWLVKQHKAHNITIQLSRIFCIMSLKQVKETWAGKN